MSTYFDLDNMSDKADGVDFVPIFHDMKFPPVYASYTKEEIVNVKEFPKTARKYWVMKNGQKEYIN